MSRKHNLLRVSAVLALVLAAGCSEVRGRRKIQEANRLYRDGNYKESVAAFVEAERFVPDLPVLWLNKGFTCRQMLIPGSKTAESTAAAKCALSAFKRYQELAPQDTRGEMLYVQTLFDSDEYETLSKMYEERFRANPKDTDSVTGLIQVYTKWNKLEEALEWYGKKADLLSADAEAQYSVGVFIWQQLMTKGGTPDKAAHDPRPDPNKPRDVKTPPAWGYGDIVSQQRIDLADTGIKYLQKAIDLRSKYHEAMTYVNLLHRQKSFAFFDQPAEWQKSVDEAEKWRCKSIETQGKAPPPSCTGAKGGAATPAPPGDSAAAGEAEGDAKKPAAEGGKGAKGKGGKGARKGKRASRR